MHSLIKDALQNLIADTDMEIQKIRDILSGNPLSEIVVLERETIEKIKNMPHKLAYGIISDALEKRENLLAKAKESQNSSALIERLVFLETGKAEAERMVEFIRKS